jgi:hypothetical protein
MSTEEEKLTSQLPQPSAKELSDEHEARLRTSLAKIADRQRGAYRRSTIVIALSLTVGIGWLLYSFKEVVSLEQQSVNLKKEIADNTIEFEKRTIEFEKRKIDAYEILLALEQQIRDAEARFAQIRESKDLTEAKRTAQGALKELNENKGVIVPKLDVRPPEVSSTRRWIVVGSNRTLDEAKAHAQKVRASGYSNVLIVYRDRQYRTVIEFASAAEARAKFSDIQTRLESAAYPRDLKDWCPGATQADGYLICQK